MKTIGFPISHKENENRRAMIPQDIKKYPFPRLYILKKDTGKLSDILTMITNDLAQI